MYSRQSIVECSRKREREQQKDSLVTGCLNVLIKLTDCNYSNHRGLVSQYCANLYVCYYILLQTQPPQLPHTLKPLFLCSLCLSLSVSLTLSFSLLIRLDYGVSSELSWKRRLSLGNMPLFPRISGT